MEMTVLLEEMQVAHFVWLCSMECEGTRLE